MTPAKRQAARRADEARKRAAKGTRSTGFTPNRSDGIPDTTRTVAQARKR